MIRYKKISTWNVKKHMIDLRIIRIRHGKMKNTLIQEEIDVRRQ